MCPRIAGSSARILHHNLFQQCNTIYKIGYTAVPENPGTPVAKSEMICVMASKSFSFPKALIGVLAGLVALWLICLSGLWWTMRQPPEVFGRVMANLPAPAVFLLFPFETLWTHARAGELKLGDPAPDFSLQLVDKSGWVQLSTLTSRGPVVLVFGSYT